MSTGETPASPYLLPPGPARRAMMRDMGIRACLLDYDDGEWATLRESFRQSKPPFTEDGEEPDEDATTRLA